MGIQKNFTVKGNINIPGKLFFGSVVRQMINLWDTIYALGVQSNTAYIRVGGRFSIHQSGTHSDVENDPGTGGINLLTLTSSELKYLTNNILHSSNYTTYARPRYNITTTNTNKTLVSYELCDVTVNNLTIFLPPSPANGDEVIITVGNFTNTIVARNGNTIVQMMEDLIIDIANSTTLLKFVNSSWRVM